MNCISKNIYKYLMALCLFFGSIHLSISQDSIHTFLPAKNSLFVEYAGTGGHYFSLNYDRILYINKNHRISGRGGIGFLPPIYGRPYLSIPLEGSIIIGKKHHLELGLGCSYIYGLIAISCIDKHFGSPCASSSLYFVPRLGYRYQYIKGGIFLKFGFTPFFRLAELNKTPVPAIVKEINNRRLFPSIGIGVGYTFKSRAK